MLYLTKQINMKRLLTLLFLADFIPTVTLAQLTEEFQERIINSITAEY